VAPTTGARVCGDRPSRRSDRCPRVLVALAQAGPDRVTSLRLENSGAPTAQGRRWPAPVREGRWPPDGPERNPMARVWRDVQAAVAWRPCPD
jgi:hypothetical protein